MKPVNTSLRYPMGILLVALLEGYALPLSAQATNGAISCTAQMSHVDFGQQDPLLSSSPFAHAAATIDYQCSNSSDQDHYVSLCFAMDGGQGSPQQLNPRKLQLQGSSGSVSLDYNLYKDPAYQQFIDTSGKFGTGAAPLDVAKFLVPRRNSVNRQATVYARLNMGTIPVPPGEYFRSFSGASTAISRPKVSTSATENLSGCNALSGARFPFEVRAQIRRSCKVQAQPLDFGETTDGLRSTLQASSQIAVTCSPDTSYKVALNDGQHVLGQQRRMQLQGGSAYIAYDLYRDAQYSQPWGQTLDVNTVDGSTTSGQTTMTHSVYGRVLAVPQMPEAGRYQDTVTITVTY